MESGLPYMGRIETYNSLKLQRSSQEGDTPGTKAIVPLIIEVPFEWRLGQGLVIINQHKIFFFYSA